MKYLMVALGDLTRIRTGKLDANAANENGAYPFFTCAIEPLSINTAAFDCKAVLVAGNGDLNVKYYEGKFNAYQRTYVIESLDESKLLPKYLYLFLDKYVAKLREQAIGGVIKYIKIGNLTEAKIPLPPLAEQKRIAAILDKAAEIKTKREQGIAKLDELVESTFIEMFGDSVDLIDNAKFPQLSSVVADGKIVTYGIVQAGPHIDDGVPYIKTGDIKNGKIIEDRLSKTSLEIANSYARSSIATNDIVMSIRATVGTTALVPSTLNGANLTQGTARISAGKSLLPKYLISYLRTSVVQKWIQRHVKGATFREITLSKLRELPVYVPNIEEQQKFEAVFNAIELKRKLLITSNLNIDNLIASLQHQAFTTGFNA
jgi:type I restriction enzyme, S subunit